MKRKLTVLTVLILILGLGLAGSASAGKLQMQLTQESTLEQIMKRGVLRVGLVPGVRGLQHVRPVQPVSGGRDFDVLSLFPGCPRQTLGVFGKVDFVFLAIDLEAQHATLDRHVLDETETDDVAVQVGILHDLQSLENCRFGGLGHQQRPFQ